MKMLYLDDSGTSNIKDMVQPVLVFAGPILDNEKHGPLHNDMENLIESCRKKISNTIFRNLATPNYRGETASKLANYLTDKIISSKFEIHSAELFRGDNEYMVLGKAIRYSFIEDALKLIPKYDIKVFYSLVYKQEIDKLPDLNDLDKTDKVKESISNLIINDYNAYLKEIDAKSMLVVDSGSDTFQSHLKRMIHSDVSLNIAHDLIERESYKCPVIQLADICAFTINMYNKSQIITMSEAKKEKYTEFYNIIKDNLIPCEKTATE